MNGEHRRSWRTALDVGSTVVMIALAAILVWEGRVRLVGSNTARTPPEVPVPPAPIKLTGGVVRGSSSARVVIIEYADFECPFCAIFARKIEPVLRRDYVDKGRILFVFRNLPLSIHKHAAPAAQAAWCAAKQNRFWDLHDRLFLTPTELEESDLDAAAVAVGLDSTSYRACRTSAEAAHAVRDEKDEGARMKIDSTPVFLFGTTTPDGQVRVSKTLLGTGSIETFTTVLDKLLGA